MYCFAHNDSQLTIDVRSGVDWARHIADAHMSMVMCVNVPKNYAHILKIKLSSCRYGSHLCGGGLVERFKLPLLPESGSFGSTRSSLSFVFDDAC